MAPPGYPDWGTGAKANNSHQIQEKTQMKAPKKPPVLKWAEVIAIGAHCELIDSEYQPDRWQSKVLTHQGSMALRTGRQVGKSVTVGKKCSRVALEHSNITILMIAAAQRQSSEIFQKTLRNLYKVHIAMLKAVGGYKINPRLSPRMNDEKRRAFEQEYGLFNGTITKTECNLNNGTRILSLPTGKTGAFIRCYTVDVLIADEAAYIAEPVWLAIRPMLATSLKMRGLGWEILLSTPFGKGGYYYNACHNSDYLQIHVTSESCSRIATEFLRKERLRLSKMEYAQEYLGNFVAEFNQFFPTELIKRRMDFIDWDFSRHYDKTRRYYLGVDVARYGADESAFVISELDARNTLRIVKCLTTENKSLTDTVGRAVKLHRSYGFRKIFTDDTGLGGGVTDMLKAQLGKSRVVGLNNAQKQISDTRKKGILKEDLYSNALAMMEKDTPVLIHIVSDLKLQRSLKSMTFEYTQDANLRIYGAYSHLAEAFVRACWCVKSKGLKLFVA